MKTINELNDFPLNFITSKQYNYESFLFHDWLFHEPTMKCFAYVDDDFCVIKGEYNGEIKYSVHIPFKKIKKPFLRKKYLLVRWGIAQFWEFTLDEAIERQKIIFQEEINSALRKKKNINEFYGECLDK